ncbi:MAG TPA: type II toxin-antitoxin system HicA family toxin [Polyangia bacterium]
MPRANGARVVRALERAGFVLLRQSGSHAQMRHAADLSRRVSIPVHKGHRPETGNAPRNPQGRAAHAGRVEAPSLEEEQRA